MPIKKEVNKDFFKKWSHDMAYILGFFFADGSYDINSRGGQYFSFQITDQKLLVAIRKAISSNHKISIRGPRTSRENTQYRLQVGSKEMCVDLVRLGVSHDKSKTMCFPRVPSKYLSSFIRGYFDGDGNVWCGHIHTNRNKSNLSILTAFTSCSHNFLEGLHVNCQKLGVRGGSLFKRGAAYRLQYSAKDSIILYHVMYDNVCTSDDLILHRKKTVFEKFMEPRN